ncbi:unnamed protein product [Closterium sp. NIES-64]|nr:unnamed protein product [Closterium sp. NIES-64]
MTILKALDHNLSGNELSGSIPAEYSNLANLEVVLCCNQISGTLPTLLRGRLKLEAIDLSNNRLHGTIPTQYTGLVRLTLLNLRNNQLTGPVLQPIPPNLTVYDVDLNYLSSGFSSPPNCSQGAISFRFNCLQTPGEGYSCPTPATPSAPDAAVQRPEELCGVFCGVSAAVPPCGGHGSCYAAGPSRVPTCDCDSGFVNGELPGSCVPEGSQGGGPVTVQPTAAQTEVKGRASVASTGHIILTASQPNTWGAAFYKPPVPLFSFALKAGAYGRPLAFTVYFSFSILKPATTSRAAATAAGDAGDGFAFVISANGSATGGSSGSRYGSGGGNSLGYASMDERSIAVEFDTSKSTDANDPDNNHVGFSVRGNTSSIATAKAPFTLNDGNPKHAWIVFDPSPSSSSATAAANNGYDSNTSSSGTGWLQVFLSAKASPRPGKAVVAMQVSLCEFLSVLLLHATHCSSVRAPAAVRSLCWCLLSPPLELTHPALLLTAATVPLVVLSHSTDYSLKRGMAEMAHSTSLAYHTLLRILSLRSFICVFSGLPEPTTLTGQQFRFRFSEASLSPVGANPFFRYASVGVQALQPGGGGGSGGGGGGKEEEVWVVSQAFSWADQGLLWPIQNQGACGDCWAYAVVGSIEMAYNILFNLFAVPLLSISQLRDALGASCSQGNSPSQAFQYLATLNDKKKLGLTENFATGVADKMLGGPFRVDGFERTAFHGWFGLAAGRAETARGAKSFHTHAPPNLIQLSKYADPECFTYNLNHVVLLVGYRLTGSEPTFPHMAPPFWIIRNLWGPEWGDGGHMRMDIQGGDGGCGINTLPGIYPVVRAAKDPCNVNGTTSGVFGPLFNPCGNFTCTPTPDGASNHCDCNDPRFVEALQPDHSRTCAYSECSPPCFQ